MKLNEIIDELNECDCVDVFLESLDTELTKYLDMLDRAREIGDDEMAYDAMNALNQIKAEIRYRELEAELEQLQDELDDARVSSDRELEEKILSAMDDIEEEMEELENIQESVLGEAAIRQFKRVGQELKKRYRCLSGPKAGKLVATPAACATRKEPRKVRQGRKVMRAKKGIIKRKSKIAKRKQISRLVTKMNKRLAGKL